MTSLRPEIPGLNELYDSHLDSYRKNTDEYLQNTYFNKWIIFPVLFLSFHSFGEFLEALSVINKIQFTQK